MVRPRGVLDSPKTNDLACHTPLPGSIETIRQYSGLSNHEVPPDKLQKKTAAPVGGRNDGKNSKGKASSFETEQYSNPFVDSTASYLIAEQIAEDFDPFDFDWVLLSERSIALRIIRNTTPNLFDFLDYLIVSMDHIDEDSDLEPWLGAVETWRNSQIFWSTGNRNDLEQNVDGHDDEHEWADGRHDIPGGQGI